MYVSAEVLIIVITVVGFLVTVLAGFFACCVWADRRMGATMRRVDQRAADRDRKVDPQSDRVHGKGGERFDKVDQRNYRLQSELSEVKAELTVVKDEIAALKDETTEVKIAVARLEGPRPRLSIRH